MYLILAHSPNPDIAHDSRQGYWEPPVDDGAPQVVEPTCMDEARMMAERYIARNQLGGGNWTNLAGLVIDGHSAHRIAYNGRVFPAVDEREHEAAQDAQRRRIIQAHIIIDQQMGI